MCTNWNENEKFQIAMEEEEVYNIYEVEDIMCDQGILTSEANRNLCGTTVDEISATKFQIAKTLIRDALLPAVFGVYDAYVRNQNFVLEGVRQQILPTLYAFLVNSISRSLSSVQRGISFPIQFPNIIQRPLPAIVGGEEDVPDKSVECCILYEPDNQEAIIADVIFIHGMHGSLVKTWRQGFWQYDSQNIKETIIEQSKSLDGLESVSCKATSKRSHSDDYLKYPCKFSKIENISSNNNNCINDKVRLHEIRHEDILRDNIDNSSYSKCWPRDWLSQDFPNCRIIALNYTTDPNLWRPIWIKKRNRTGLVQRSYEMTDHLQTINIGKYPIIWVGHSKGGLYIKQILINCWQSQDEILNNMLLQTKAIMFYSVPHRGATVATYTLPFLSRSIELLEVQRDCQFVLDLHKQFLDMLSNDKFEPEIFSFLETSLTFMTFVYLRIIPVESADPGVGSTWGVPLDHREICKPSSKNCFLYKELVRLIDNVISKYKK